jgi:hypothetical protein
MAHQKAFKLTKKHSCTSVLSVSRVFSLVHFQTRTSRVALSGLRGSDRGAALARSRSNLMGEIDNSHLKNIIFMRCCTLLE